ncbi:MAG: hypothetical protein KF784_06325 [Fimbriimonadaceae bacterium]|nr:hypothetical protein [Fimbriimonadaceae bacterium]
MRASRSIHTVLALFGAFLLAPSILVAQDRTIITKTTPVFEGARGSGIVPFALTVRNNGADTQARIVVPVTGGTIEYPFSLPSGSEKRVVFFSEGYGGYGYSDAPTLRTDRSSIKLKMPEDSYSRSENIIGMISDVSGLLGFLSTPTKEEQNSGYLGIQPAYVSPKDAPDRFGAYEFLTSLVLGEGCERLSDDQVEAIQRWTLAGGALIISTGANTALLHDPRWQSILPLLNPRPITIPRMDAIKSYAGGQAPSGAITIVTGDVAPDTVSIKQGDKPVILTRRFGLGAVTLFAFDAFAGPMETFEGRRRLFTRYSRISEESVIQQIISRNAYLAGSNPYERFSVYSGPAGPSSGSSFPTVSNENPFKVETPPAERIIWILVAYFAVVVPLNFTALRLMKRGEWAWLSAPLISIGFAIVFFQFASGLYSSEMATNTGGTLIVDSKSPHSVFIGSSQMFFPRGGGYDLGLKNVEYVRSDLEDYGYYYYGGDGLAQSIEAMRPVDVGEVISKNMRCNNLAFYQVSYAQNFEQRCILRIKPVAGEKFTAKGGQVQLTNDSPYELADVTVSYSQWSSRIPLGTIGPGETATVVLTTSEYEIPTTLSRDAWVVQGAVSKGLRPGPQVGKESNARGIRLFAIPIVEGVKVP